jgi:hypothetical protein
MKALRTDCGIGRVAGRVIAHVASPPPLPKVQRKRKDPNWEGVGDRWGEDGASARS